MNMRLLALAAAASALTVAGAADAKPRETGEARLARLLEGRVAGRPTNCIRTWARNDVERIDGTALVFGRGEIIYVNRTDSPQSIDEDDAWLVRQSGTVGQLCRTDIVTTFEPSGGFYTGNVFLSEFVPYRRVRR